MINHRIDIACDITDGVGPSGAFLSTGGKKSNISLENKYCVKIQSVKLHCLQPVKGRKTETLFSEVQRISVFPGPVTDFGAFLSHPFLQENQFYKQSQRQKLTSEKHKLKMLIM